MADKAVVRNSTLDAIARAIVEKGGATGPMKPGEMAAAIASIPSGGGAIPAPVVRWRDDTGALYASFDPVPGADTYFCFTFPDDLAQYADMPASSCEYKIIQPSPSGGEVECYDTISDGDGAPGWGMNVRTYLQAFNSETGVYSPRSNPSPSWFTYCFLRDTAITLADGTRKPCQDVTYDDDLLVWDFDRGCRSSAKPLWIKRSERTCYSYVSTFDDGTVFRATGPRGHRVFSVDEQKFIYNTEAVGHHVLKDNGTTAILLSTERVAVNDEFYNIITDRHLNCYADGILTSTHLNNRRTIRGMKFVEEPVEYHDAECFAGVDPSYVRGFRLCESGETVAALAEYADHCWRTRK